MKQRFILSLILIFACSFFCFFYASPEIVKAEETSSEIIVNDIDGIYDEKLYNGLLWNNYNKFLPTESRKSYITKDMFSNLTHLDLSGCEITNLMGLEQLELPNLKSVDLSNNNLTFFYGINCFNGLTELNLSYNKITDISEVNLMPNLISLDLSYNNLSEIDLSALEQTEITVDLMQNKFNNINQITLNSQKLYKINLIANYFTESEIIQNAEIDYYYQRNTRDTPISSCKIKNFGGYSYENFSIKIYQNNENIASLLTGEEILLNVGLYEIKFFNNNELIFNEENNKTYALKDYELKIIPETPVATFYQNNKEYEFSYNKKIFGDITIKFNAENINNIKISLDGVNYTSQNEITISELGKHTIYALYEENGVQSKVVYYEVVVFEKLLFSPVLTILLCITFITLIMFALRFYANRPINFNKKKQEND